MAKSQTVVKEVVIPEEGQCRVSLFDIDPTVYENYRSTVPDSHINDLSRSLGMNKNGEQIHNISGVKTEDGLKIGLVAGFCRYEAMQRNALKKIVKEYNAEFAPDPNDEEHVKLGLVNTEDGTYDLVNSRFERERIREKSEEWAEKYDEALKSYEVNVVVNKPKDEIESLLKNVEENEVRQDAPLVDLCRVIDKLLSKGVKGREIAKRTKISASKVSQVKKINELVPYFESEFEKKYGEKGESPDAEHLSMLKDALAEYNKRIALPKGHEKAIPLAHAREFSYVVLSKDEAISLSKAEKLLLKLVRFEGGKPTNRGVMDWGIWQQAIKDAKVEPEAPKAGESGEESGKVSSGQSDAKAKDGKEGESVDTLAEKQEGDKESRSKEDEEAEAELKRQNEEDSDNEPAEVEDAEDTGEDADEDDSDLDEEDYTPDEDELSELEGESEDVDDVDDDLAPPVAGEKRATAKDAPEDRFRLKTAENIEAQAKRCIDDANAEDCHPVDRVAFLLSAVNLYEVIGLDAELEVVNEAYVEQVEAVMQYFDKMREVVGKKASKEEKAALKKLKPEFEGLDIEIAVSGDTEDDDSEE